MNNLDIKKYPKSISGQQQRIAIIRALLSNTRIILADEPTASIDEKNSKIIIEKLKQLAKKNNKIVIIVTHDVNIAKECDKRYFLENGKLSLQE